MTRKDFELIAATIREVREFFEDRYDGDIRMRYIMDTITGTLAGKLKTTNPRFDSERFMRACATR